MKTTISFLLGWVFFSPLGWAHDQAPPHASHYFQEIQFRYFKKIGKNYKFKSEFKARNSFANSIEHHLKLGINKRLAQKWKMGLFYQVQKNERHDNDWKWHPRNQWYWKNHKQEYEHLFGTYLTYRRLLSPTWMFEWRTQYEINTYQAHQQLKLRPSVHYFWMKGGRPFINVYFQYEHYLPLNFGDYKTFQNWIYLGGLYHFNGAHKMALYTAYGGWNWKPSGEAKVIEPGVDYSIYETSVVVGLAYIISH